MPAPNFALGQVALKRLVTEAVVGIGLGVVGGVVWSQTVTKPHEENVKRFYQRYEGNK
jgi:hypothetical protein